MISPMIGKTISHYHILEKLGGGKQSSFSIGMCAEYQRVRPTFRSTRATRRRSAVSSASMPLRSLSLNSEVEGGFIEIGCANLGSGCGLRVELRRSWGAVR